MRRDKQKTPSETRSYEENSPLVFVMIPDVWHVLQSQLVKTVIHSFIILLYIEPRVIEQNSCIHIAKTVFNIDKRERMHFIKLDEYYLFKFYTNSFKALVKCFISEVSLCFILFMYGFKLTKVIKLRDNNCFITM